MEVDESWHRILGLSSDEEGLREGLGAAAAAAIGATAAGQQHHAAHKEQ